MYYWAVTPIDAQGNEGERSETRSFVWDWPSTTTPTVEDVVPETEFYVPEFSWDPVPGAAKLRGRDQLGLRLPRRRVQGLLRLVRLADHDAPSRPRRRSRTTPTTGASARSTRTARRATGTRAPRSPRRSPTIPLLSELGIKNLHMRDVERPRNRCRRSARPATRRICRSSPGIPSRAPRATRSTSGTYDAGIDHCDFGDEIERPLALDDGEHLLDAARQAARRPNRSRRGPGPRRTAAASSSGQAYCVQVRARSGRVNLSDAVWGDFTQLDDGTGAAFTFSGFRPAAPCSPSCSANYLGARRLPASAVRGRPGRPDRQSALHLEPDRRQAVVLGHRRQGSVLHDDRRLRVHADPCIRSADAAARRARIRTRRRRTTGSSSRHRHQRKRIPPATSPRRAPTPTSRSRRSRPTLLGPDNDATFALPPTFSWTVGAGREEVPPAGRHGADVRFEHDAGRHHDRRDGVHGAEDVPRAKTLYWRVQAQDENNNGPHVVRDEDLRGRPRAADARPGHADGRRFEPAGAALVPGSGRGLLQPADPRAQRHDAEHVLRASPPRPPPSRRSPARDSSRGRSGRTSRS